MYNIWVDGIIIALLVGLVVYLFAKDKGYNPDKWFAGAVATVFLIITAISFWKKRKEKAKA